MRGAEAEGEGVGTPRALLSWQPWQRCRGPVPQDPVPVAVARVAGLARRPDGLRGGREARRGGWLGRERDGDRGGRWNSGVCCFCPHTCLGIFQGFVGGPRGPLGVQGPARLSGPPVPSPTPSRLVRLGTRTLCGLVWSPDVADKVEDAAAVCPQPPPPVDSRGH